MELLEGMGFRTRQNENGVLFGERSRFWWRNFCFHVLYHCHEGALQVAILQGYFVACSEVKCTKEPLKWDNRWYQHTWSALAEVCILWVLSVWYFYVLSRESFIFHNTTT